MPLTEAEEKLKQFREFIISIEDESFIDLALETISELQEIFGLKERLEKLESEISEGEKATFWFFTLGLGKDEINNAGDCALGRKSILHRRAEKEKEISDAKHKEMVNQGEESKAKPLQF